LNAFGKKTAKQSWAAKEKIERKPTTNTRQKNRQRHLQLICATSTNKTIDNHQHTIGQKLNPVSDLLAITISVVDNLA
jgi:hypothetical protein